MTDSIGTQMVKRLGVFAETLGRETQMKPIPFGPRKPGVPSRDEMYLILLSRSLELQGYSEKQIKEKIYGKSITNS